VPPDWLKFVLMLAAVVTGVDHSHLSLVQIKAKSLAAESPELPQVEAVMSKSTKTFNGVMEQATMLQSTLVSKQKQFFAQLARQKLRFETQLDAQQKENGQIKAAINEVVAHIHNTRHNSAILRNSSAELMNNVSQLRIELKKLESKLNTARSFAALTLNSTSDSVASKELEILNTPKPVNRKEPRPDALAALGESESVEQAMEYMVYGHHGRSPTVDDEDETVEASLLQVSSVDASSELSPMQPDLSLISSLSTGLQEIAKEYEKATEKLKAEFNVRKDAGARERAALLSRKERTTQRLESLSMINSKLETANKSLKKTKEELTKRISGLKTYLFQLSGPLDDSD